MLKDMKTHTHLKRGRRGRSGSWKSMVTLLCVRYRYDEVNECVKVKKSRMGDP